MHSMDSVGPQACKDRLFLPAAHMDLLQPLAAAALEGASSRLTRSTCADGTVQRHFHGSGHRDDGGDTTDTATELLGQIAACVAHVQQQQQQHHGGPAVQASGSNPLVQLQVALQSASQQLQELVQQQGRQPGTHTADALPQRDQHTQLCTRAGPAAAKGPSPALGGGSSSSPAVLQQLLHLAVGEPTCPASGPQAGAGGGQAGCGQQLQQRALPPAAQQQQWQRAAWEAVQLFSLAELGQLPPAALQQALLLRPQLLYELLQAAAAAVLQPLLPAGTGPGGCSRRPAAEGCCSGSSDRQSIHTLLSAACPWWQHLPGILAAHPLLLLQASSTLSSWLEASGHTRLWLLLSLACRPAWQYVAAAAATQTAAASPPQHAAALEPGQVGGSPCAALTGPVCPSSAGAGYANSDGGSSSRCGSSSNDSGLQTAMAGAFLLLCPSEWQQRLVRQLVQQPSPQGLLRLLQLLPGLPWPAQLADLEPQQHHQQQQPAEAAAASEVAAAGAGCVGGGTAADAAAAASPSIGSLSWPSAQEWQQATQAGTAGSTAMQGLGAWALVVQHHCWYQLACYLLVHSCLAHGTQQQQQREKQLEERPQGLSDAQLVACAASFIAWVHQPLDAARQGHMQQVLLAATAAAHAGDGRLQQHQDSSGEDGGSSNGLKHVEHLLRSVKPGTAIPEEQQQQQQQRRHGSSTQPHMRQLAADLALAAMQQLDLLLSCPAEQLIKACAGQLRCAGHAAAAGHAQGQQQSVVGADDAALACCDGLPTAAACQLLDGTNEMCAAAVEVVRASVHTQAGGAQQCGDVAAGECCSWLACQWLREVRSASSSCSSGGSRQGHGGSSLPPGLDLRFAKRLLAATTECDQLVKHGW